MDAEPPPPPPPPPGQDHEPPQVDFPPVIVLGNAVPGVQPCTHTYLVRGEPGDATIYRFRGGVEEESQWFSAVLHIKDEAARFNTMIDAGELPRTQQSLAPWVILVTQFAQRWGSIGVPIDIQRSFLDTGNLPP